jgi:hypothetical protein
MLKMHHGAREHQVENPWLYSDYMVWNVIVK